MTTIGQRIKKAREDKGLTQAQLGKLCGWGDDDQTAQSRISMYENDKRTTRVAVDDIKTLAKALGVEPGWIMFNGPLVKHDPLIQNILETARLIPRENLEHANMVLETFVPGKHDSASIVEIKPTQKKP